MNIFNSNPNPIAFGTTNQPQQQPLQQPSTLFGVQTGILSQSTNFASKPLFGNNTNQTGQGIFQTSQQPQTQENKKTNLFGNPSNPISNPTTGTNTLFPQIGNNQQIGGNSIFGQTNNFASLNLGQNGNQQQNVFSVPQNQIQQQQPATSNNNLFQQPIFQQNPQQITIQNSNGFNPSVSSFQQVVQAQPFNHQILQNFQPQKSLNPSINSTGVNALINSIAAVKEVNQMYSVNEIRLMDYKEGRNKGQVSMNNNIQPFQGAFNTIQNQQQSNSLLFNQNTGGLNNQTPIINQNQNKPQLLMNTNSQLNQVQGNLFSDTQKQAANILSPLAQKPLNQQLFNGSGVNTSLFQNVQQQSTGSSLFSQTLNNNQIQNTSTSLQGSFQSQNLTNNQQILSEQNSNLQQLQSLFSGQSAQPLAMTHTYQLDSQDLNNIMNIQDNSQKRTNETDYQKYISQYKSKPYLQKIQEQEAQMYSTRMESRLINKGLSMNMNAFSLNKGSRYTEILKNRQQNQKLFMNNSMISINRISMNNYFNQSVQQSLNLSKQMDLSRANTSVSSMQMSNFNQKSMSILQGKQKEIQIKVKGKKYFIAYKINWKFERIIDKILENLENDFGEEVADNYARELTLIYGEENNQKTLRGDDEVRYYDSIFSDKLLATSYQLYLKLKKDVDYYQNEVYEYQNQYQLQDPEQDMDQLVTVPSFEILQKMREREITSVKNFQCMNQYGKIQFLVPVNLKEILYRLDEIILIEQNKLEIYPDEEKPQKGQGLNQPAIITLRNFNREVFEQKKQSGEWNEQQIRKKTEQMKKIIKKFCDLKQLTIVEPVYDPVNDQYDFVAKCEEFVN